MGTKFSHYRSYDKHRGANVIQATMAWNKATIIHGETWVEQPVWVGSLVRRHPDDQPNKRMARAYAHAKLNSLIVDSVTIPEIQQTLLEDGAYFDSKDLSIVTTYQHILQAMHKLCLALPNNIVGNFECVQQLYEADCLEILDDMAAGNFNSYNYWVDETAAA